MNRLNPSVQIDPPKVSENTFFDFITNLSQHTWAWIICLVLAALGMMMWKKPIGKGIIIGAVLVLILWLTKR